MPKVSINILTKNRGELLGKALASVGRQSFTDFEVVVVNDGSTDDTASVLGGSKLKDVKIITHQQSMGIIVSRQEALEKSVGDYVAVLDDDDEWIDGDKLKKQVEFLEKNPEFVLVGGGIKISNSKYQITKLRPQSDNEIRKTMLFRNNFFTSTVMFRRGAALKAGGFIKDGVDVAEDYDLWLRMGQNGKMYNFPEVFTLYSPTSYNKDKFKGFLQKQAHLIAQNKASYPYFWLASLILKFRIFFGI